MDPFPSPYHSNISVVLPDENRQDYSPDEYCSAERNIDLNQFHLPDALPGRVDGSIGRSYQRDNFNNAPAHTVFDAMEGQNAFTEHNQEIWTGMDLDNQPWAVPNSRDVNPGTFHQSAWSYNAPEISGSVSLPHWVPNKYTSCQSSSIQSTSELHQSNPIMNQDVSLSNPNMRPLTSHPLRYRSPGNTVYAEHARGQASSTVVDTIDVGDAVTRIGSVLSNGKFMCEDKKCAGCTFGRQAELQRHYNTIHAINKPNFWCCVSTCPRSMSAGGEAFHRKDKLIAHVRAKHPDMQRDYP